MPKARKVVLYDIYDGTAVLYASISRLTSVIGISSGNATHIAQGNSKENYFVAKGQYLIFYTEDYTYINLINRIKKAIPVLRQRKFIAYDEFKKDKQVFTSTREAEKVLGVHHTSISRVLRGIMDEVDGYKFWFVHEIKLPETLPQLQRVNKN